MPPILRTLALGFFVASAPLAEAAPPSGASKTQALTDTELVKKGEASLSAGRADEARKSFRAATELNAKNVAAWRGLARALDAQKRDGEALRAWERVAALDGADRDARLRVARARLSRKQYVEALPLLREADGLGPLEKFEDLMGLAKGLRASKDLKAERAALKRAAATPAGDKDLALQVALAEHALAANETEEALERSKKVLALDPRNRPALLQVARALVAADDLDRARPHLMALEQLGAREPFVYASLARIAEKSGDWTATAKAYARATQLAPKDRDLALAYGRALAKKGDANLARAELARGLEGRDPAAAEDLELLLDAELATKKPPLATARRLIAVAPQNAKANALVGEALFADPKTKKAAFGPLELGRPARAKDAVYAMKVAEAALEAKNGTKAELYLGEVLTLQPQNERANLLLGEALLAKGDTARAIAALTRAAATRPRDERLHRVLADAQQRAQDTAGEEKSLQVVAQLAPKDAEIRARLGRLLYEAKKPLEAQPHLEAALRAKPKDPTLLVPLAVIAQARGDQRAAGELAIRALSVAYDPRAQRVAGLALSAQGKHAEAEKLLAEYTKTAKDDVEALAALGKTRVALGDLAGAKAPLAVAAAARPNDAALQSLNAITLVRLEQYAEAKAAGEAALKAGAKEPSLLAALGYAAYRTGDASRSNELLLEAERRGAKESYIPLVKGENYMKQADRASGDAKAKELENAKAAFNEALRREPSSGPANFWLGKIAYQKGEDKKAVEHLSKTVKEAPGNVEAAELLGRAAVRAENWPVAKAALEKVPMKGHTELLTLRGQAQANAGDPKAADESYREALEADPNNYRATVLRGDNFLKLPHWDKAKALYEQAAKLAPKDPEPVARLAKLHEEMGDTAKAEEMREKVAALDVEAAAERRKKFGPDEVVQVGVGNFKNTSPAGVHPELAQGIPEELVTEFTRIGKLEVLDRLQLQQRMAELGKQMKLGREVGLESEDFQSLVGKVKGMKMAVVGSYAVQGDRITINARIIDEQGRAREASTQSGTLEERGKVQRKVALELAGLAVPLDEADKQALSRPASTTDLGLVSKLALAREAELRGDMRAARQYYQEALKLDADNAQLIARVKANEARIKEGNKLVVVDFAPTSITGSKEPWVGELSSSIREVISTKLAASGGVTIIDDPTAHEVFVKEMNLSAQEQRMSDAGGPTTLDPATLLTLDETLKEKLSKETTAFVLGSYVVTGDTITLSAKLRDRRTDAILVTVNEDGKVNEILDVENRVAEKLLRALLGSPTEQELAAMRSSTEYADFMKYKEELARRAESKTPETPVQAEAPKPEVKPEEKAPEAPAEVAASTEVDDEPQEDRWHLGYQVGTWATQRKFEDGKRDVEYGTHLMQSVVLGWDYDHTRNLFSLGFLKNQGSNFLDLGGGNAEYPTLRVWELAWNWDYKILGGDPFFNILLGFRLGGLLVTETPAIGQNSAWTGDDGKTITLFGDAHGGVAINPLSWISIYGQAGYDYALATPLRGVTIQAGAAFRL